MRSPKENWTGCQGRLSFRRAGGRWCRELSGRCSSTFCTPVSRSIVWVQLGVYVHRIQLSGSYQMLLHYEKANLWEHRKELGGPRQKQLEQSRSERERERGPRLPSKLCTAKKNTDGGQGCSLTFILKKHQFDHNKSSIGSNTIKPGLVFSLDLSTHTFFPCYQQHTV